MEIKRVGSEASSKGPADWFTGTVRIDPLFNAPEPACAWRKRDLRAGARTACTHPLGQTLIVTSGLDGHSERAAQSEIGRGCGLVCA
jgi:quercetin dioxygenase-like cupin family protein